MIFKKKKIVVYYVCKIFFFLIMVLRLICYKNIRIKFKLIDLLFSDFVCKNVEKFYNFFNMINK